MSCVIKIYYFVMHLTLIHQKTGAIVIVLVLMLSLVTIFIVVILHLVIKWSSFLFFPGMGSVTPQRHITGWIMAVICSVILTMGESRMFSDHSQNWKPAEFHLGNSKFSL